tara:strand:- start:752 stop:994 length:243 start_codon:yes stop_codon:yes gene_type:complete
MIKNSTIAIHEFASAISLTINRGDCLHTRYAYSLNEFNAILKNELSKVRSLGLEPKIERSGVGKFGGITYKNLHLLKQAS